MPNVLSWKLPARVFTSIHSGFNDDLQTTWFLNTSVGFDLYYQLQALKYTYLIQEKSHSGENLRFERVSFPLPRNQ